MAKAAGSKSGEERRAGGLSLITVAGSILAVLVAAGAALWLGGWLQQLGNPVVTPLAAPQLARPSLPAHGLRWGTYRPHTYFGLKTRTAPHALLFGMMWRGPQAELRHFCDQNDRLRRYTYTRSLPERYSQQVLMDSHLSIETEFVARNSTTKAKSDKDPLWTAQVAASPAPPPAAESQQQQQQPPLSQIVLYFYLHNEASQPLAARQLEQGQGVAITGHTPHGQPFLLQLSVGSKDTKARLSTAAITSAAVELSNNVQLMDRADMMQARGMQLDASARNGPQWGKGTSSANTVLVRLIAEEGVTINVSFGDAETVFDSEQHGQRAAAERRAFDKQFEDRFRLGQSSFAEAQQSMARDVLSNAVGGMGYWYGQSLVRDVDIAAKHQEHLRNHPPPANRPMPPPPPDVFPYFPAPLFSAVPSRSFFPRGFLWDEGFHQLLIRRFQPELTVDALSHWLDLMNAKGWIPREQILGPEARSKVPDEFVIQPSNNANPPSWFLVFEEMLKEGRPQDLDFLRRAFPRLQKWFAWYDTQRGHRLHSYHWRGRKLRRDEMNALTLTSGLDDYPRAAVPSEAERHVDLRCWMALAARVMARIAKLTEAPVAAANYETLASGLYNNSDLVDMHWSSSHRGFYDYGMHRLKPSHQPKKRLVTDVYGYVTLYPLMLQILDPASKELGVLLEDLDNTTLLWTPFGLRSLATTSRYYQKNNREHDPPYWRGAIWINLNYLTVRALNHYAKTPGPYQARAADLESRLRSNLINNIYRNYQSTGYIWEQYDDSTGKGKGAHPFTGWSALVVLLMADQSP